MDCECFLAGAARREDTNTEVLRLCYQALFVSMQGNLSAMPQHYHWSFSDFW